MTIMQPGQTTESFSSVGKSISGATENQVITKHIDRNRSSRPGELFDHACEQACEAMTFRMGQSMQEDQALSASSKEEA